MRPCLPHVTAFREIPVRRTVRRDPPAVSCPRTAKQAPTVPNVRLWFSPGGGGVGSARRRRPTRSRFVLPTDHEAGAGRNRRRWPTVDGADDLAAVDALQVDAHDAEVRVLDMRVICQLGWGSSAVALSRRVGVSQLVGREAPSHACGRGRVMQLFARGRRFPTSSGGRSVDHAQHGADGKLTADIEPGVELVPCPAVHSDLSALAALSTPDEHRAAGAVQVAFLESERFADPKASAPEQHDQRPEPVGVGSVTDTTHYRDDLLDRRRVGRVLLALVPRWAASVIAGHGRRDRRCPATSSSTDSMNPPFVRQIDDALLFEPDRDPADSRISRVVPSLARLASPGLAARTRWPGGWENRLMDAGLLEVRNATYRTFVELGRAPSAEEVAGAADRTSAEVEAVWRELHRAHALVLNPATTKFGWPTRSQRCRPRTAFRPPDGGGTATARGTRSAFAQHCARMAASRPPARIVVRRSRSTYATSGPMMNASCSIAWSPRRTGGTTSSSPEAR